MAAAANRYALRRSTTRIRRYANAPDMLLAATSASTVPATSAGSLSKNMRSAGTRMKPPPAPTITPNTPVAKPISASISHSDACVQSSAVSQPAGSQGSHSSPGI